MVSRFCSQGKLTKASTARVGEEREKADNPNTLIFRILEVIGLPGQEGVGPQVYYSYAT